MIFAVVLITAITIMFVSSQELMMTSVRAQSRYEGRIKQSYAFESAVALVLSDLRHANITPPASKSLTVAGLAVSANVVDYGATIPRTVKITTTVEQGGKSFVRDDVRGWRISPDPWYYALFVDNSELNVGTNILTVGSLGSGGDTYYGFSPGGTDSHIINGDLECTGTVGGVFSVTGTKWEGAPSASWPMVTAASYLAAATTVITGDLKSGYTFPNLGPSTTAVLYKVGDLDVSGTFSGNGVVVCTGTLILKDAVTSTGGKLVLISLGDTELDKNGVSLSAFVFTKGFFRSAKPGNTLTGALVCSSLDVQNSFNIVHDPYFWNNPSERVRFKLPGNWP